MTVVPALPLDEVKQFVVGRIRGLMSPGRCPKSLETPPERKATVASDAVLTDR